ncbi:MAG: hypothetical protein ACPF8V_06610 [Luteibaculum sp.]
MDKQLLRFEKKTKRWSKSMVKGLKKSNGELCFFQDQTKSWDETLQPDFSFLNSLEASGMEVDETNCNDPEMLNYFTDLNAYFELLSTKWKEQMKNPTGVKIMALTNRLQLIAQRREQLKASASSSDLEELDALNSTIESLMHQLKTYYKSDNDMALFGRELYRVMETAHEVYPLYRDHTSKVLKREHGYSAVGFDPLEIKMFGMISEMNQKYMENLVVAQHINTESIEMLNDPENNKEEQIRKFQASLDDYIRYMQFIQIHYDGMDAPHVMLATTD